MRMQERQVQELPSRDGGVGEIGYLIRIADHKINRLDELEALLPCF
jgi:hypothetical protein